MKLQCDCDYDYLLYVSLNDFTNNNIGHHQWDKTATGGPKGLGLRLGPSNPSVMNCCPCLPIWTEQKANTFLIWQGH